MDYQDFREPTLNRFDLTLQRQLPGQMVITVGYVGAAGPP